MTILKKIRDKQWFGSSDVPSYLMTHPAVDDRLAYLDTWIQGHPEAAGIIQKRDNTDFRRFRLRLTAAYGDPDSALRQMKAAIEKSPGDPLVEHGYGVALARNNQPKEGLAYIKKALEKKPFDAVMLKDLGETAFIDGQYDTALKALEGSRGIDAGDFETYFLLGRTRLERGEYPQAAEALKEVLKKKPDYLQALYYLGEAYGKEGQMGDAHYYLGKYYHERGDFKTAAFHLRQVIKHSQDPLQKANAEEMLARGDEEAKKAADAEPEPDRTPRPRQRRSRSTPFSYGQNGRTAW